MVSSDDLITRLSGHFANALGEVKTQLQYHAKQATREIALNLDSLPTPFCTRISGPLNVQCSLFANPSSSALKKTSINVSGSYKFNFNLRFHPDEPGVVLAKASGIPEGECTFKWRRVCASYQVDLEHIKGERLVLTADDIGASITVEVTPNGNLGTAIGTVGPLDVDVQSRRLIQEALVSGTARHEVFLEASSKGVKEGCRLINDSNHQRWICYIMCDQLVIQPSHLDLNNPQYDSSSIKFRFSSSWPRISLSKENSCVFDILASPKEVVTLRAFSRQQRDLIVLTARAFHSRLLITNSYETNSLEVLRDGRLQEIIGGRKLELVVALQKLTDDLSASLEDNGRLRRELDRATNEKSFLESEMSRTISVFQAQLSVSDSGSKTPSKSNKWDGNENVCAELVTRNATLLDQISSLKSQVVKLEQQIDIHKGEVNRQEKLRESLTRDLGRIKAENEGLHAQVQDLRDKIRRLAVAG